MINSGLWILLIAISLFLGWYIGYQAQLTKRARNFRFPRDYLLGLNYLLNEQPDKAVDIFIKMLDVDSDTVETHLALGNLFRRRGELNRAILIHQNLIEKTDLEHDHRVLALSELGQDYLSAGVLDRAENVFKQAINLDEHPLSSLSALLDIYQQEKNWQAAIAVAKQIELVSGKRMHKMIAHYYCQLSENYLQQSNNKAAIAEANHALSVDKNCVRANLLLATIERDQRDYKQALKTIKRIAQQSPDLLTEALSITTDCYLALGDKEGLLSMLSLYAKDYTHYPFIRELIMYLRQWKGDEAAYTELVDFLKRAPSIQGLRLLIELRLAMEKYNANAEELTFLQELVKRLVVNQSPYRCQQCGFSSKTLHWQCPSCKNWETMKYQKAS